MTDPSAGGAAYLAAKALGGKALFAGLFAVLVSVLSVVVGFTIVPLTPGKETLDASRRFAAGLFCSFTAGPVLAFKAIDTWPWLLTPWQNIFHDQHPLVAMVAAMSPFIALTAVIGFWVVAALMRWFVKREGKDIQDLIKEAKE